VAAARLGGLPGAAVVLGCQLDRTELSRTARLVATTQPFQQVLLPVLRRASKRVRKDYIRIRVRIAQRALYYKAGGIIC